jgi:hypothetical protein
VLTGFTSTSGAVSASDSVLGAIQKIDGNINLKASLTSPEFTGDAKAITPVSGDNDLSIATTEFVTRAVSSSSGMTAIKTITSDYTAGLTDYTILCNATSGELTLTLPTVESGKIYLIVKIDDTDNKINFGTPIFDTITSDAITATNYNFTLKIQYDGSSSKWYIIN